MAEKEERILEDQICFYFAVCSRKDTPKMALGMPRQDAINRMARAICNMGDEKTWGRVDDNYKHYCTAQAEWALNALLGEAK